MPEDTIINFEEDISPVGTEVIDSYASKGVTFRTGSDFDMGYPIIERIGQGLANSGDRVLVIRNCSGDFCQSKLIGKFDYTREQVQVLVGELRASVHTRVTLYAFDAHRNIVASKSAVVTGGSGVHTRLMINRLEGDIDTFWVVGDGFVSRLAIDDLRFSNTVTPPDPDFGIARIGPMGDGVRQGFSATATITVNRVNGSVGDIFFEATDLPPGVTASFSPNPISIHDTDETLLTLSASPDAHVVSAEAVTVTGTPRDSKAGKAARGLTMPLTVAANFAIESLTIHVPCAATTARLKVYTPNTLGSPEPGLIPAMFSGPIDLSLSPLSPGIEVKLDPSTVSLHRGEVVTTVRINPPHGRTPMYINLNVEGKSPPYPPALSQLILHRTGGSADSFIPTSGKTPHSFSPGTDIVLIGSGFCPATIYPIEVQFGNKYAKAKVSSTSADGKQGHVAVPRLATNGHLTAVSSSGASSVELTGDLTVQSHRNTNGFKFENPPLTGIEYSDLDEAFGKEQTWTSVTIDPCEDLTFGIVSCEVVTISLFPSLLGIIIKEIIKSSLTAHCYGMSVTSERLLKGHLSFGGFTPPGASSVWKLNDVTGPEVPLSHHIRIQCFSQFSSEVLKFWLDQADLLSIRESSYFSDQAKTIITSDLRDGNYPFIMVKESGGGHVVVAYDLEESDDPDIAYYIYIYDPNVPFTIKEDLDPEEHLSREQTMSRIPVYKNGRFKPPPSLGWEGGNEVHGHLIVVPYNVIPFNPTFPTTPEGVIMIVSGSASIEQVTDAKDRKLFNRDGTINTDPATRLVSSVAPWVPFNGISQSEISKGFILGDTGFYRWRVKGIDNGKYSNFVLSENIGVQVDDLPVSPTSTDEISLNPLEASFGFHTGESSKPLSVKLVAGASDSSMRTIVLKTTSQFNGYDEISFDASRDTIFYRHGGEPTTFTVTLGWAGNSHPPTVFTSEPISIGPGETAAFHPTDWHILNKAPVELLITGPNNPNVRPRFVQSIQDMPLFTIDNLNVQDAGAMQKNLQIHTTLSQLKTNSTVVLIWMVTKDNTVIGQYLQKLSGPQLDVGPRNDSWTFLSQEPGQFNFTAGVLLVTGELPPRSQVLHQTIAFTINPIDKYM